MPLRPTVCSRAVQRQLSVAPDGIWISDDALARSFTRFASSIPGPLEARRRLGKRRITQQSQYQPTPTSHFGGLWGFFPEVDRTQWQWKAPTKRQEKQDATMPVLPAWLSEPENTLAEDVSEPVIEDVTGEDLKSKELLLEWKGNLQNLRHEIRNASSPNDLYNASSIDDLRGAYQSHLSRLKQDIALGLVPEYALSFLLQDVTQDFHAVSFVGGKEKDQYVVRFYTAVWEGITACQVLRPTDLDCELISSLLNLLTVLTFSEKVQDLAKSILLQTSAEQHLKLEISIISIVNMWSQSWLPHRYKSHKSNGHLKYTRAGFAVSQAGFSLEDLRGHILSLENSADSDGMLVHVFESLSSAKSKISEAENAIANVEDGMWPIKFSAKKLAATLDVLPSDMLARIIPTCSENIVKASKNCESDLLYYTQLSGGRIVSRKGDGIPYHWLMTLSHMPKMDDRTFFYIWKELYVHGKHFSEAGFSNLVLNHWISQGLVTKSHEVGTLYATSAKQDFASLFIAIDKWKQDYWGRLKDLFLIAGKLGRYKKIYQVLLRMRSHGMKVPWRVLRTAVAVVSNYDPRLAIRIYKQGHALDCGKRPFSMEFLKTFVSVLIQERRVSPAYIWEMLDVPIYSRLSYSQKGHSSQRLSAGMERLMNIIALEFARHYPRRVALRQIENSLHHLRVHGGRLGKEISQALTHVGITTEITEGNWIVQQRLAYVVRHIENIEGTRVAEQVDRIVFDWRSYFVDKSRRMTLRGHSEHHPSTLRFYRLEGHL